jgi:hypothetical protein
MQYLLLALSVAILVVASASAQSVQRLSIDLPSQKGIITLSAPAPAGNGANVQLSNTAPKVLFLPSYVQVPANATTMWFPVNAKSAKALSVTVTATYANTSAQTVVSVSAIPCQ